MLDFVFKIISLKESRRIEVKPLTLASKWGDRVSETYRLTPALKSMMFSILQMDQNTKLKVYSQKMSEKDFLTDPNLPSEFISKITKLIGTENVSTDSWNRIQNSVGRGYIDIIRTRLVDLPNIVELVTYPHTHEDVVKIVQLANEYQIPISIVAGKSTVTDGIKPPFNSIAINLTSMDKVLSIQKDSHYITAQTGISGPKLEEILNHQGLTLGHFPQSFEYSCLGGWIATRGAGQNSTLYGKIEDMVMGMKVVTGSGKTVFIPPFPARATGPDLNQLFTGSEGAFGIITEVTLRVWKKPEKVKFGGIIFRSFEDGLLAYKELMQTGYRPAILRLSDAEETYFNIIGSTLMKDPPKQSFLNRAVFKYLDLRGYVENKRCLGILSFEGDPKLASLTRKKAISYAKKHGGVYLGASPGKLWFKDRYELPFIREPIVDYGILVETFETSTTWDKILNLYNGVRKELKPECPVLWTHGSHFYQNGANLYFTLLTPQEEGNEIQQFLRIKGKMLDAFIKYGGSISHHHGIGRAYNQWFIEEIKDVGESLLKSLKNNLDPNGIMNSGIFNL